MSEAALVAMVFAALAILSLLIADAVTGTIEARRMLDDDDPAQAAGTRARELTWTVAVTALIAVLVAFGVDVVVRRLADLEHLLAGVGLLALVALATFGIGLVAAIAAVRRERPAYARIRRDLRDRVPLALQPDELDEFEARLARADRVGERPVRASSVLRLLGALLLLLAAVGAAVAIGTAPAVLLSVLAALLGLIAVVVGLRAERVRAAARTEANAAQRAEVVALLERARIPARQPVPGLRDRVSRALAILREQQR